MTERNGVRGSSAPVQVTVFNQTYKVVSDDGGERALRVARFVDERMREIASQITTHEVARIAVIAALHIADELLRLRDGGIAPRGDEAEATTASPPRISWFDSVFDSELGEGRGGGERLSSRVAERLQARQSGGASSASRARAEGEGESGTEGGTGDV